MLTRTLAAAALILLAAATPAQAADPALTAILASRPAEFAEPADFQAYTVKLHGWMSAWRPRLDGPRQLAITRRAELAEKVAAWGGEVVAAKRRVAEVEAAHASPVASARADVASRRDRLIDALVPGRGDAGRHAASAASAADTAQNYLQQAASAASGLTAENATTVKSTIESALSIAKTSAGTAESEAQRARDAIARDGDAGSVDRAMRDLSDAVLALAGHERRRDADLVQPNAALARAQAALDGRTAAWRQRLDQAERDLRALEEPYNEARADWFQLGNRIGVLQGLNWKLFKGFDAGAYLEAQGRLLPAP